MSKNVVQNSTSSGGAFYGLGLIGALVYYISAADGFWEVILAVLQSFVWPAFLVYELMQLLDMQVMFT